MKHSRRLTLFASFLILTIFIGGCGIMTKEDNKEEKIKKSFEKTLSMYPIKNLEDLYDKEGYRDEEFDKDDKGTWTLNSEMVNQPKGKNMKSRGMVLYMNRNSRTTKGYFFVSETIEDSKGRPHDTEKKYPVKMKNNEIIPIEKINDEKLKNEIDNFKFFLQYANFKDLNNYKNEDISYNPNVPSYAAEYDLDNGDYNVKQLRKRYDIPTKQAPKLLLKGTGDLKGSSLGYKDLEFTFVQNQDENIYFTDSVNFNPSKDD
ncbi:tandem-type lipoprotein [Staphylococcus edaphicus]|uniref:Tandem-type lipoprotein n=1 Tax=Staphylococcus edaphicus TaxID=1955013 RepID=A0A2C6WRK7_9STAP|nr:tandem-type lipoprotein [Staphylococcus edaphicus]PHK50097.1 tandem-type lipoprotein [Staphylococcus edaphicus]UQW81591.1 tandem-type lipoprotein [Staphylococcus edaphicus]